MITYHEIKFITLPEICTIICNSNVCKLVIFLLAIYSESNCKAKEANKTHSFIHSFIHVVTLKTTENVILQEFHAPSFNKDKKEEKLSIIRTAAKLIKQVIKVIVTTVLSDGGQGF